MDQEKKEKGFNGIERGSSNDHNNNNNNNNNGKIRLELVMRVLVLGLTLATAIILGVSKQTKIVSLKIVPTLPPVDVSSTAKATYLSAFVYNISANAIACGYTAISTLILLVTRGKNKALAIAMLMGDLVMVALLFSGTGAAGAIGLMGFQGNKHVMWNKVCNVFGKFCHKVAFSLILSLLASIVFMILVVFDALRFTKS